jgi:hypothetical protein
MVIGPAAAWSIVLLLHGFSMVIGPAAAWLLVLLLGQ